MKTKQLILLLVGLLILMVGAVALIPGTSNSLDNPSVKISFADYTDTTLGNAVFNIAEPISYKNLQIFPIRGTFNITERTYIALEEAMEKKYVDVVETEQVNELKLNNTSDQYIFLHSGDIVKGGKQDRTIQYDVIIPPKEKNIPIASFCVERGRWNQRVDAHGNAERTEGFSASKYNVSSRKMKVAAKKESDQGKMWMEVSKQQEKIVSNVKGNYDTTFFLSNNSPSSMLLTLEDSTITELRKRYKENLSSLLNMPDIVGLAYAVNGEVYGIDLFNSGVFLSLREKMIDGFIVEAVADQDSSNFEPASVGDVLNLLKKPNGKPTEVNVHKVNAITYFEMETFDRDNRFLTSDLDLEKWVHLNVIHDDEEESSQSGQRNNVIEIYNGR
ncbi:MAG: hypothetical protein H6608_08965 [Flavobacteriales bacterium]|nr:hypothetical protein [Bacteroidota bacterium]MCB9241251.1 hypothetical protein [Flavobacteriales bacterium]